MSNTTIRIIVETDALGGDVDRTAVSTRGHGDLHHFETVIRAIFAAEGFPPDMHLDLFEEDREIRDMKDKPVDPNAGEPWTLDRDPNKPAHDCMMTRHTDGIHCDKCGKPLPMSMCAPHGVTAAAKSWLGDEFPPTPNKDASTHNIGGSPAKRFCL